MAELLILSLVSIVAVRKIRPPEALTRTLNLISLVLVILNIVPIVAVQESNAAGFRFPSVTERLDPSASGPERDVYYLVFDRYAGAETLSNLYGFDNSGLYKWLSDHGFEVTKDALANYPQTPHSLASSLNMSYLDDLARAEGEDSSAWTAIRQPLRDSAIARTFQAMGYKYEHIGSWWEATAADPTADDNYVYGTYTEFLGTFLRTTAIPSIERLFRGTPSLEKEEWNRVHFQMRALGVIASDREPTFTFAHFLLPHVPYVFHADGSFVQPIESPHRRSVRRSAQVHEEGNRTGRDGTPGWFRPDPIIVIQSDEGPHPPDHDGWGEEIKSSWARASDVELGRKLRILNADYLPGDPDESPTPRSLL